MPVLARLFESAGLSTVMVTNMPFWAEKVGAPRTLAVEFPFGHILGPPHDPVRQRRVIDQALDILREAREPGAIVHSTETWPDPLEKALADSHPLEPPPIMSEFGRHVGHFLRGMRRRSSSRH